MYPAILTTHNLLLEQRSQAITTVECLLSVYISDLLRNAIALMESTDSCPEWEFVCELCMPPLLEMLLKGDFSKVEDDICELDAEEMEYDPFAEGEEDVGACFILTDEHIFVP